MIARQNIFYIFWITVNHIIVAIVTCCLDFGH
jgi:hypothetical protein